MVFATTFPRGSIVGRDDRDVDGDGFGVGVGVVRTRPWIAAVGVSFGVVLVGGGGGGGIGVRDILIRTQKSSRPLRLHQPWPVAL